MKSYCGSRRLLGVVAILVIGGCNQKAVGLGRGLPDPSSVSCTDCHGDRVTGDPAPPRDLEGRADPALVQIGAHQQHLKASKLRGPVACDECHVVPANYDQAPHNRGRPAKLVFGALATRQGTVTPAWSHDTRQCSNTYCHGAGLAGGDAKNPDWTRVDGSQITCDACHGNPPPKPHPQQTACATCHPATVKADGTLDLAGAKHINGTLEVVTLTCTTCHGDATRPGDTIADAAPPTDTLGNTDPSAPGVGAHQAHLAGEVPISCQECHVVPTTTDHSDGQVELAFGTLASTGGVTPSFDGAGCSSTYCHGTFSGGNAGNTPTWTGGPAGAACGTCHGSGHDPRPGGLHPTHGDCGNCHAGYTATTVNTGKHVNGVLDVTLTCTSCHGTPGVSVAPPTDTLGNTATTAAGVGAHQAHLTGVVPISCTECHVLPSSLSHSNGVDDVTFGTLATSDGATPAFDGVTCAGSYCHGAFKNGNAANAPSWTGGPDAAACGTCHGTASDPRPGGTHPARSDCGTCHPGYTATTIDPTKHVNGVLDSSIGCTTCHGTPGVNAAPPLDTTGQASTGLVSVGAHQAHVTATPLHTAIDCAQCHPNNTSIAHSNGTVDMTFGALAGAGTVWTRASATCASDYCHGGTTALKGGGKTTPVWTTVDGTQKTCTSCHGNPPPVPHVQNTSCGQCHPGYTNSTVTAATHVNGTVDLLPLTCTSCHGTAGVNPAPPADTQGRVAVSNVTVGAHQKHVATTLRSGGLACVTCHPDTTSYTTSHANGAIDLTFAGNGIATATTWTGTSCTSSYCHGGTAALAGGTNKTPVWTTITAGPTPCTSCHGNPPPAPHVQNTSCGQCHTGYTNSTVAAATHLNGTVDVLSLTCTSCHGTTGVNPAPPADTTGAIATSTVTVGAHQKHVATTLRSSGLACVTCHPDTTSYTTSHANGAIDVTFAGNGFATATTWTGTSCTSSYCHGGTTALAGGTNKTPVWTTLTAGATPCTSCHGTPPTGTHTTLTDCNRCHPGATSTSLDATALTKHINGVVDVTLTCTSCHGTVGGNAAPPIDTAGNTATTAPGVGAHQAHVLAGPVYSQSGTGFACTTCHPNNGTNMAHKNGTIDMTFAASGFATGTSWTGTGCATSYCHGNFPNGRTTNTPSWTAGPAGATCGACHGNGADDPTPGNTHPVVGASQTCGTCHLGYTRTSVNLTTHVNGTIEYVTEPGQACPAPAAGYACTPGATGTSCGACHTEVLAAMTSTPAAGASRHFLARADDPTDPSSPAAPHVAATWSSPLKSSPGYAEASCVRMCHDDHPHTLTSPATTTHEYNIYTDAQTPATRAGATHTSATRSKTDFDGTAVSGGLCVSCHQYAITAGGPTVSKTLYDASAHDFISKTVNGTTYNWNYVLHSGTFNRNCTKCHADPADARPVASGGSFGAVHSSTQSSLLAGTKRVAGAPGTFICYDCHGDGTNGTSRYAANVLTTDMAKAVAHPVNADAVHDSTVESTVAAAAGATGNVFATSRHANCLDCHEPHAAKSGTHTYSTAADSSRHNVSPPLTGVSGVSVTYGTTNFAPPAYTWVPASPTGAAFEYQICFKCHSSFAWGTGTPPSGISANGAQINPVETDVAAEFSPANRSGHPIYTGLSAYTGSSAPKALPTANMKTPWDVNVGTQTMMCSDCHNTDAASTAAQGPHGSAVSFMLRGPNTAWPNVTLANYGTSFCANCHNDFTDNPHSTGAHQNFPCYRCHVVVPHGSKMSRLIADNDTMPARYGYNGALNTQYIQSFTKASTQSGYSESNCRAQCHSAHSSRTPSENW
jgi:predicted CxxxxCH...CXXCH cytochrome family protein